MYIEHKGLTIPEIEVEANMFYRVEHEESVMLMERRIAIQHVPNPEVQQRLMREADNCPVSKILKGNIKVTTDFKSEGIRLNEE
jgi:putative redox protein